jgi:ankyrin repeat protein
VAAFSGKLDPLRTLLELGADPEAKTKTGETALMLARRPSKDPRRQSERQRAVKLLEAHTKASESS